MPDTIEYEWSLSPELGIVDANTSVSFTISVERIETTANIIPEDPPTVQRFDVDALQFEQIIQTENDLLPDKINININSTTVIVAGIINTPVQFIDIAYSNEGVSYPVDAISDIPKGAKAYKLIPDDKEIKDYYWKVFAVDDENGDLLIQRTYHLQVRLSFNDAKQTIQRIVSEIL
jgi:hypothetical protein